MVFSKTVPVTTIIFWDMVHSCLVGIYQHFRETCYHHHPEDGDKYFFRNDGIFLPNISRHIPANSNLYSLCREGIIYRNVCIVRCNLCTLNAVCNRNANNSENFSVKWRIGRVQRRCLIITFYRTGGELRRGDAFLRN